MMTTKSIARASKYNLNLGRGLEVHRLLNYSHDEAEKGSRRFRTFHRERVLHIGQALGEGSVKHAVYRGCDVAVGLILSAINSDAEVQKQEVIREASAACYNWTKFTAPGEAPYMHPIIAALEGTERDQLWVMRIDIRKSDQSGKIAVSAVLYDGEAGLPGNDFPPDFLPHVTMLVHLGPLLKPLIGAINGRDGAN